MRSALGLSSVFHPLIRYSGLGASPLGGGKYTALRHPQVVNLNKLLSRSTG